MQWSQISHYLNGSVRIKSRQCWGIYFFRNSGIYEWGNHFQICRNQTLKILFVYLQKEKRHNRLVWRNMTPAFRLLAVKCEQSTSWYKSYCLRLAFLSSLICLAPPRWQAELNKLIIVGLMMHTRSLFFLSLLLPSWNQTRLPLDILFSLGLALPEATNCHGFREELTHSSVPVWFLQPPLNGVSASSGSLAFVWRKGNNSCCFHRIF